MDNIKEFKVNGTAYGLNLSEIGAVINDGGTQKELKQYIDSHSGGGGGGGTSSKVVRISKDWYNNQDAHQTEIKKALDDIYNEVSNNRTVTVIYDGFHSQSDSWVFETDNIQLVDRNYIIIYGFGWAEHLMNLIIRYYEESNHYSLEFEDKTLAVRTSLYLPYIYQNDKMQFYDDYGNISELISELTVDNDEFVVVKTTVPAYTTTNSAHQQIYYALRDDYGFIYYISKFGGIKIFQNEDNANYDLLPDGEWYVVYNEMASTTYTKCIVTKAVRNVDGTLDVYLGFKGYDLDSLQFYDCTVENKNSQNGGGKWNEKNWTKVSDAQNISVDSFMARRTMYFCTNTEGVKVDKITLFKRMK